MKNIDNSIQLKISAYFNGQLSPEEEAEILRWIKESKENREYFFQLKRKLDPEKTEHPLLHSSYAELRSRMLINKQFGLNQSSKLRKLQVSFSGIAALMLIALTLGFAVAYLLTGNPSVKSDVVWFETQVQRGEKSQLLLPDGSKVWMNSESNLSYPGNFMEGNREVKLKGEAYFEVAKLNGSAFTVETKDYNIRVLGTKFNVMAYEDFNRTETTLIEGKIKIQHGKQLIDVAPGQTFIYKDNRYLTKNTNAPQAARWKDDIFDFDQVTFQELVVRLERWYDVDIEVKSPELNDVVYSGVFRNEETIMQVLNTFQLTMPISYTREDFRKFSIN